LREKENERKHGYWQKRYKNEQFFSVTRGLKSLFSPLPSPEKREHKSQDLKHFNGIYFCTENILIFNEKNLLTVIREKT
jgi:hypothetical protein